MPNVRHGVTGLTTVIVSLLLVALVAVAIAGLHAPLLLLAIAASAFVGPLLLHRLFPDAHLLWIAFINLLAVYASLFQLFVESVFSGVGPKILPAGFILPILAFLVGCWRRRAEITGIAAKREIRTDRSLLRSFFWLAPVWLVGAAVILLMEFGIQTVRTEVIFLAAMALIGIIVIAASRDVAIFLVYTGLLFDEFFQRIVHHVIPMFAFLTVYSLLVVVFASMYRVLSSASGAMHFVVDRVPKELSFADALHFSIATLSTVGYGDIVPVSSIARSIAAVEVVFGIMLLLFGVSELIEYARERRRVRRSANDG
jgi:voltage-gated potassium channel